MFCLARVALPGKPTREVRWNGKVWRQFNPQPSNLAISCFSPSFCVANDNADGGEGPYWNGKIWQGMPSNSGGCAGAWCSFDGIGCASATICWDSGTFCDTDDCDGGEISFSDTWDGAAWNQSASFNLGSPDIACAGRAFHNWGFSWQDATANLATACHHLASCDNTTERLACGSPHFCLALPSQDPSAALVWNGTKWGVAKLALVKGHLPKLSTLSCGAPDSCISTGTYQLNPRSAARPVIELWNGSAWKVTQLVNPPSRR
jgi:hypothetical protein